MSQETPHKILIVEDDECILSMYKCKLELEGFIVFTSTTGLDVLELINEKHPDVVLIDIMMPGISGFTILESIKKDIDFNIKIIIFSNLSRPEDIARAHELGADDFFIKANLLPKDLVAKLQLLLTSE